MFKYFREKVGFIVEHILKDSRTLTEWTNLAQKASAISPKEYRLNNVKRGLRNSNGTGVIVGVTRVSEVTGYNLENEIKIAIPGKLYYRGIDLLTLAQEVESENRFGYDELVYLLLFDQLPNKSELNSFEAYINSLRELPKNFKENAILNQPADNIMNHLQRMILSLYSYDQTPDDTSVEALLFKGLSLIAKMPIMISYSYMAKQHYFHNDSLVLHSPLYGSTAENVLHMVRKDCNFTNDEVQLLDLLLMVQAEHGGGNNSTFTTNVVSSSGTDIYSIMSAAIGSLKGVKHGGANLKVAQMIDDLFENVDGHNQNEVETYLENILAGKAFDKSGLIYGMGHAVYTISDPRAELLKHQLSKLVKNTTYHEELQLLTELEITAKKVFKKHRGPDFEICANVDFYSGFAYKVLNIPLELYTPLFATARMGGWLAHVLEQTSDGKIMRPAYVTISNQSEYKPLEQR